MFSDTTPRLTVLPLGGCGEVGLNATLLIYGTDLLLIDCGALLGVWDAPGIEKAVPGFEPLFVEGRKLCGVVLTHGHEDHIGGLPALLDQLDVPVFGTPTTIAFARSRLERSPAERRAQDQLRSVPLGGKVSLGPFEVELIRVTHSIPESAALHIQTPAGRVLHSGDFKLDPTPVGGPGTDVERLRALRGVDLLLSDSTNAEVPGHGRSESAVVEEIERLVATTDGRVMIALFASHLHRIGAAVNAAQANGRKVLLAGRSLVRTWEIGVAQGILPSDPTLLLTPEGAARRPRREVMVLATGTQGELTGGLSRIAGGQDAALRPQVGDRVVMSARTIPGNEIPVRRIVNQLARRQIEVIHDRMAPVHCSGHARSEEQREMLDLVRPRSFVPVHGERTMLEAHARIGAAAGVEQILVIEDGNSVCLSQGQISRGPDEPVSKRMVDRGGFAVDWGDVKDRRKIGREGLIVVSLALDGGGALLGRPAVQARGRTLASPVLEQMRSSIAEAVAGQAQSKIPELTRQTVLKILRSGGAPRAAIEVQILKIE